MKLHSEQGKKFVLLASFADLERHPEVEETVEDEDDDHVAILFGQYLHSSHGCFPATISWFGFSKLCFE